MNEIDNKVILNYLKNMQKTNNSSRTINNFRRYFATINSERGMSPKNLMILMGHSKYQTTLGYINNNINNVLNEYNKIWN